MEKDKNQVIDEEKAKQELEKEYKQAEALLEDNEKMESFLENLEKKLKEVPKIGDRLSMIPTLISLVKSYYKKEYTKIPVSSMIAVISALIYFLSPIDLIPDTIIGVGYIDDAVVIDTCLKLVNNDIKNYKNWREENKIRN